MSPETRFPQPHGTKGSLKWMQRLVRTAAPEFTSRLQHSLNKPSDWTPTWISPLDTDDRAEYRDDGFLAALGLQHLDAELRQFWPRRGPQWDGLATVPGGILLVEAKAHFPELGSSCGAGSRSATKIRSALEGTKRWAGASPEADWMNGFYQYANRLAHLRFFRERGVDAHLVFLYFFGETGMPNCPQSEAEWQWALGATYTHLGLSALPAGVASVFLDVASIPYA